MSRKYNRGRLRKRIQAAALILLCLFMTVGCEMDSLTEEDGPGVINVGENGAGILADAGDIGIRENRTSTSFQKNSPGGCFRFEGVQTTDLYGTYPESLDVYVAEKKMLHMDVKPKIDGCYIKITENDSVLFEQTVLYDVSNSGQNNVDYQTPVDYPEHILFPANVDMPLYCYIEDGGVNLYINYVSNVNFSIGFLPQDTFKEYNDPSNEKPPANNPSMKLMIHKYINNNVYFFDLSDDIMYLDTSSNEPDKQTNRDADLQVGTVSEKDGAFIFDDGLEADEIQRYSHVQRSYTAQWEVSGTTVLNKKELNRKDISYITNKIELPASNTDESLLYYRESDGYHGTLKMHDEQQTTYDDSTGESYQNVSSYVIFEDNSDGTDAERMNLKYDTGEVWIYKESEINLWDSYIAEPERWEQLKNLQIELEQNPDACKVNGNEYVLTGTDGNSMAFTNEEIKCPTNYAPYDCQGFPIASFRPFDIYVQQKTLKYDNEKVGEPVSMILIGNWGITDGETYLFEIGA